MTSVDHTRPAWLPLAATLLDRLTHSPLVVVDDEGTPLDKEIDLTSEPESLGARLQRIIPLAESLPPDAIDAMLAEGEDPFAVGQSGASVPPRVAPDFFDALAAVRLANTIGGEAGFARIRTPRAMSILEISDTTLPSYLERVLRHCQTSDKNMARPSDQWHVLTLRQPESEKERRSWARQMSRYVARPNPLLFLCTDARELPKEIQNAAQDVFSLAPLDHDGLLLLLERLHSATGQVARAALRARMPAEEALARLSATTIAAAFRARTTFAVVDRLVDAARPPQPSGDLSLLQGMGELEQAAQALVEDFIGYQQRHVAWRDMTRSLILNGPPGVGKTFAAGVIAEAAGARLITGTVGEWQSAGHLGDMLREMRATFSAARAATPAILFIDELDGFGSREDSGHNGNYRRQVVNEFLNLLNGLADQEGCVIIGATNDVSQLDPAIVRPGRFDQIIQVTQPGPTAVAQILRHHVRGDLGAAEVDDLARQARGRTAADIEAAVRAARGRARSERVPLAAAHVAAALAPNSEIPESLSWRIAVHEGGHALVAHLLGVGRVESVRLTPDGGLTTIAPRHSEGLPDQIEALTAYQLGGRAAERLLLGNVGSGSGGPEHSDLARATRAALEAELSLGAGATGLVWLPPDTRHLANPQLRERVSARLEAAEARAFAVLSEVRPALDNLARVLLRERVLEGWSLQLLLTSIVITPGPPVAGSVEEDLTS